jgi:hypothetical protein
MQKDPSQIVGQVRSVIYPLIDRLNEEKHQTIGRTSVREKRNINKAISYFENGLDLVEKAFFKNSTKKKKTMTDNGSRSGWSEESQRRSYRRQPEEQVG